ncbi:MAG: hypothetical protein LBC88_07270 [Spirochaetaceae bacterium]|nr:hypothetical protein [Spirochaetaceae bacterium]
MRHEARKKETHAKASKGFHNPQGNLDFKADMAIFPGGDMAAFGVDMLMVILRNDINTRENNGRGKPDGHYDGKKGSFPRDICHGIILARENVFCNRLFSFGHL